MTLRNQNPNGLSGSEVRPQPPHCDKNSYILESPPFQCWGDFKAQENERQPIILATDFTDLKSEFLSVSSVAQLTSNINPPGVLNTEEVSKLAVVHAVVNDEVSDLT